MEAWRRQLNDPVSAFPVAKAGPAHIATLKTFDPPLDALDGRRFRGAERRGKRLLFPTDDGELVLLVHLMTAGRLKFLRAGDKGPKTPAFALEFAGRLEARPHGEREEEARRRLAAHAGGGRGRARAPRARSARARAGAARRDRPQRVAAAARAAPQPAPDRGDRPRVGERDPPHGEAVAVRALGRPRRRGGGPARGGDRRGARARPRATRGGRLRREDVPRPPAARRAVPRLRHADRAGRLRGAHDLLLPRRARPAAASSRTAGSPGSCGDRDRRRGHAACARARRRGAARGEPGRGVLPVVRCRRDQARVLSPASGWTSSWSAGSTTTSTTTMTGSGRAR